ncbi:hypothetical protein [Methylocystis bryophila]|uniref:Uncharacterized protein n=1 Tax=Methylocystis bryophila TaxID=655015 RepID=A0A1W6MUX0_9HYPH|nr:hypothetical protein [Methylocystis bryophila]ARN81400.1 hypothetical protein B1812_10285 [Methylocystis bryophila]BDV37394.1 hypothetical protein DSM21852_06470 [Methylocystis bryophila]
MGGQNSGKPETPRGEVEILPPEGNSGPWGDAVYTTKRFGTVKIVRLGPVGSALLGLGLLGMVTFGFLFLGGLMLLLLPIAGVLTFGAMLSGLLGNPFRRLR